MLLGKPAKLGDSLEKIWDIYLYIKGKLFKKKTNSKEKLQKLKKEFLELYECAKEKEKDVKTNSKNKTKMSFYYIELPYKGDKEIFARLRYKHYCN